MIESPLQTSFFQENSRHTQRIPRLEKIPASVAQECRQLIAVHTMTTADDLEGEKIEMTRQYEESILQAITEMLRTRGWNVRFPAGYDSSTCRPRFRLQFPDRSIGYSTIRS